MIATTVRPTSNARAWILMPLFATSSGFALFDLYLLMSLFTPGG